MGPKCNYKKEAERDQVDTYKRGGGSVTTEKEIGMMWTQAKEHLQPPEAGRSQE